MALKPDRHEFQTNLNYYCNSVTERGVFLVHTSSGSGLSLDNQAAVVSLPGTGSPNALKVAGMLLQDVVPALVLGQHQNWYKPDQIRQFDKCTLGTKGFWVTNMIAAGVTPVAGDLAYLAASGLVTNAAGGPQVGKFLNAKDQNGFAQVEVNIP